MALSKMGVINPGKIKYLSITNHIFIAWDRNYQKTIVKQEITVLQSNQLN